MVAPHALVPAQTLACVACVSLQATESCSRIEAPQTRYNYCSHTQLNACGGPLCTREQPAQGLKCLVKVASSDFNP